MFQFTQNHHQVATSSA